MSILKKLSHVYEDQLLENNAIAIEDNNKYMISSVFKMGFFAFIGLIIASVLAHNSFAIVLIYTLDIVLIGLLYIIYKFSNGRFSSKYLIYTTYLILVCVTTFSNIVVIPNEPGILILNLLCHFPFIITDKFRNIIKFELLYASINIIAIILFKESDILFFEMVNVIMFVVVCLPIAYSLQRAKLESYELNRQNEIYAYKDYLTGLYNRRALTRDFLYIKDNNLNCNSMILIDIDDFKVFNDVYGYDLGDQAIRLVCNAITEVAAEYNINFYRYGGEEFLGVPVNINKDKLLEICNKIQSKTNDLKLTYDIEVTKPLTISIGYAILEDNSNDYSKLFKMAEDALCSGKNKGKNQIVEYQK